MEDQMMGVINLLNRRVQAGNTKQKIALRCEIILCYLKGKHTALVAQDLEISLDTAHKWIKRWQAAIPEVLEQWFAEEFNREKAVMKILEDNPRSGAKPKFTAEQKTHIQALACRSPSEVGRPISHWTHAELADEAVKQGMVPSVSVRSVGRFLKSGRIKTSQKSILAQSQDRG